MEIDTKRPFKSSKKKKKKNKNKKNKKKNLATFYPRDAML